MLIKKGISALQFAREMEITHKSALFVLRRIRHGLSAEAVGVQTTKLTGTVEIDETYVGGKPRYRYSQGRGAARAIRSPWSAWCSVAGTYASA